jgi:hypothetical protein
MTSTALDCEPYYFNAAGFSTPACVFFDGHVGPAGCYDANQSDARVRAQTGHGLQSRDTPMGDGYFQDFTYDPWLSSYHILTIEGIKGRDFIK